MFLQWPYSHAHGHLCARLLIARQGASSPCWSCRPPGCSPGWTFPTPRHWHHSGAKIWRFFISGCIQRRPVGPGRHLSSLNPKVFRTNPHPPRSTFCRRTLHDVVGTKSSIDSSIVLLLLIKGSFNKFNFDDNDKISLVIIWLGDFGIETILLFFKIYLFLDSLFEKEHSLFNDKKLISSSTSSFFPLIEFGPVSIIESKRNFVLIPLYEISKKWTHPKYKLNISQLLKQIDTIDLRSITVE